MIVLFLISFQGMSQSDTVREWQPLDTIYVNEKPRTMLNHKKRKMWKATKHGGFVLFIISRLVTFRKKEQ